ncbi:hypothetical protein PTTG_29076 [Puccinia triticina 1-1 BBBD Race 1]|uniref:Rab-GAP TBC domain-containing protein n=1 Tax=Puccinia triticina (isolate 1-1 / race 1 (BBBD)) TaxID=630390 RepID=A0A180G6Q0_PUCT1|nr:hypothetical protein PTTG_29076 [Puccinia triticina 1-1 BBBD Race 1]
MADDHPLSPHEETNEEQPPGTNYFGLKAHAEAITTEPTQTEPEPEPEPTQTTTISLSDQPHRIPTQNQLLHELSQTTNTPTELLLLALVRELSRRLSQAQDQLTHSQRETSSLRDLLSNTYAAGRGEIERCLLRARVPPKKPPTATAWHLQLEHPLGPSCPAAQLDLDDLREAMSDNPCFDTLSAEAGPSRSQLLTSPAARINQHTLPKKTTTILNGKYRKSAPIPPIRPTSSADHHQHPNPSLHKRTTSIASSLSALSSSAAGTRQPPSSNNNVWGLYGWKWNKRNKTNTPATGLDGNGSTQESALSPENGPGGGPHHPQDDQHTPPLTRPKRSPTEASNSTILSGLFDSLTRRKRAESSLQKPSLQSFNSPIPAPGSSSDEPFPASINASSNLLTRSPSLILNSSSSINTQTTSSSPSCSSEHLSPHPQQTHLTLSLPSLATADTKPPDPSSSSSSQSALASAPPSALHSASSASDLTPPFTGTDRLPDSLLDHCSLDPASSNRAPSSQSTPLAKLARNPTSSSDPAAINRRPSLINLKSPAESFVSTSKALPTLATHAETTAQGETSQLPPVITALSGDHHRHRNPSTNTGDHTHPSADPDSSSYSQSVNSSLTGPQDLSDRTNSTRLRSPPSHPNLSIRSSKSSVVTSASQMKSKPQVKLTQPATTKSYLSTATGTIGKALGTNPSSELPTPAEFEPNVTTVPKAAFGRLASVYFRAPDSRASASPSRSSNKASSTSILSTGQAPPHRVLGNRIPGITDQSVDLKPSTKDTTLPNEPSKHPHHHRLNKLNLKFLPPLSNSTMELSTFINPQSNPPPFSNFNRDEEARGLDAPPGPSPGAADDEPIIDRFGFIVDAKYGLKLMRKSRDKKKQLLAKERLAALGEQHPPAAPRQASTVLDSTLHPDQPPTDPALSSETSSTSLHSPSDRVLPLAHTSEENSKLNSTRGDASVEGSDLDHTPMVTTALPIKSQVDVEAELSSLREALGLSPAPKPAGKEDSSTTEPGETNSHQAHQASSADPVVESSTQSIRRLLFQLNEMQNMLEKKQMEAWGQFITKRRMKLMRVSNSSTPSHGLSSGLSVSDPSSSGGIQGTGAVSPASVGAFLGTGPRQGASSSGGASSPTGLAAKTPHSSTHHPSSSKRPSMGGGDAASVDSDTPDLITCHDDDLIGIASMGLSNDNNKKALKDEWKEFRALVIQGIPISLRPKIWLECSGASQLKEPGYYHDLLNLHAGEEGLCLTQIECDVTRTLPTNVYFGGDGPGVSKLRRVLAAMSWHNPVVGYCQGMNMVAATLLLTIPSEEDAFWILVCIVDKILPAHYYTSHLLTSQADQRVLKVLVGKHLAELAAHFEALDVELPAITFGWFLSLFADALPIQTLLRVFDLFLIDGSLLLFRIALALLKINAPTILSYDSPASLYAYMRGPMTLSSHHADLLVTVASRDFADLKNSLIVALRAQFVDQIKLEMGLPD